MNQPFRRLCGPTSTDLAEYMREIRAFALLSPAEERDLSERWRNTGCKESRDALVCANLRLVVYVARRYAGLGVALADLVEAGNVGLLHAADRFEPERGVRFSTYAVWWIKRGVLLELEVQGCLVRVPAGPRREQRACRAVMRSLSATLGRGATDEEVSRGTGLSLSAVRRSGASASRTRAVGGMDDGDALGGICDSRAHEPGAALIDREARAGVRRCLKALPGAEAEILRLRYGVGGRPPLTIKDISRKLGVPVERVERLIKAGLGRLEVMLRADSTCNESGAALRSAAG